MLDDVSAESLAYITQCLPVFAALISPYLNVLNLKLPHLMEEQLPGRSDGSETIAVTFPGKCDSGSVLPHL